MGFGLADGTSEVKGYLVASQRLSEYHGFHSFDGSSFRFCNSADFKCEESFLVQL